MLRERALPHTCICAVVVAGTEIGSLRRPCYGCVNCPSEHESDFWWGPTIVLFRDLHLYHQNYSLFNCYCELNHCVAVSRYYF